MKKIKLGFLVAALIIAVFAAIILCRVGINHVFAKMVDSGNYYILFEDMEDEARYVGLEQKVLEILPYDAYVMNYNIGNNYYKNGDYSKAQVYYQKCLEYDLSEEKECSVRINLTMTKIQQIDFNTVYTEYEAFQNDEEVDLEALIEKIDGVIDELKSNRTILTEKNCAGEEDNNGHSQEAETLKKDIDDKIEELEKMKEEIQKKLDEQQDQQDQNQQDDQQNDQQSSQSNSNNDSSDDSTNDDNASEPDEVDDTREDEIKESIKSKEEESNSENAKTHQEYDEEEGSRSYWNDYDYYEQKESEERIW